MELTGWITNEDGETVETTILIDDMVPARGDYPPNPEPNDNDDYPF